MKDKAWILVLIVVAIAGKFYYDSFPFSYDYGGYRFTVYFPKKPIKTAIPLNLTPTFSVPMDYYRLVNKEIEYGFMVVSLPAGYEKEIKDPVLVRGFGNYLRIQAGPNAKVFSKPIFFGSLNGTLLTVYNGKELLYARYYLLPTGLVCVYTKSAGDQVSREARQYVENFKISLS